METKLNSKGKRFFAPAIAAGLMLAMAFTLSACGGDGGGGGDDAPASSSSGNGSPSSSSSGGISSSSSYTPGCTAANNTQTQYCSSGTMKTYGSVTYEGQAYKTVVIGNQTWMAENLNFNADGSRCYGDDEGNCEIYGRLYDWATAMGLEASCNSSVCSSKIQPKHQGVCPSGWHIPSGAEWQALVDFAGGDGKAGTKLKSTSGWNAHATYGDGTDDHGFSALPGGLGSSGGIFSYAGDSGYWWSSSENGGSNAYIRRMIYSNESAYWDYNGKSYLFSVRCLQD
ncbi:MAG: fibrobacter succinogenes major paralogous domain-containing protein [Fibromonadaceae bacterium]|jgi:uncharacterized protein (TIGR02145 family)|nr:fibrobacter succinogenes major paralogous domain-containing protein [Fibromonadaceae bacterium]